MKFTHQFDTMDCGPACLSMISSFYGKQYSLQFLRENSFITKEGVSLFGISEAAKKIGFETFSARLNIEDLAQTNHPCILHWNQNHFVVLKSVVIGKKRKWKIADPRHGVISISDDTFAKSWILENNEGIALFLNPTNEFYSKELNKEHQVISFKYLINYLKDYKKNVFYLLVLMLIGSMLSLVFPFLTQNLIDKGVNKKDLSYIQIILISQLALFIGAITIEFIRNWITLYLGTRISVNIISDFLSKMLRLPIKFFDSKMIGDYNQRIQDNERIENFLTSQSLITFFSMITFFVFFGVLFYYDYNILIVYLGLTSISILWSYSFLKRRKVLDFYKFHQESINQDSIYEILHGVTEMKLNNFTNFKLSEWQNNQNKLLNINIKFLKLEQFELSGFEFINQLKNIIVTFLAAKYVIEGKMSLGALLSVSYIIGQMNTPVNQLISFFRSYQEAKLSLERLTEVQNHKEEETPDLIDFDKIDVINNNGIVFSNVFFKYDGSKSSYDLENINFNIPENKITAIVGASGSGKTTLMKLILKFYEPISGEITYNSNNLNNISSNDLRKNCGVVMQDGYIFSDTIERNIVTGDEIIDIEKFQNAIDVANLRDFISSLPLGSKTKIGASGNGLSGGQKQRILIARSIYKNPKFIFFDEATSSLDSENEKIIHDNLNVFFKKRTVLIIAHRLSTVKNADQIIVLKNGSVKEIGSHNELVNIEGEYFNLIKNQLELSK